MKVLLINLNYDAHITHPPLGLGYIASFLRNKGHEVEIFDGTVHNAKDNDYLDKIKDYDPGIVGISVLSRGHNKAKGLVSLLKKNFSIPLVLGGTQVSAYPVEIFKEFKPDFCIAGEGEVTFLELLEVFDKKRELPSVAGLIYLDKGEIKVNPERKLIENIDDLPAPAWDLIPPLKYRIAPILAPAKAFPVAPIVTTRGCPYQCTFCASNVTWNYRLRKRSIKNVVDEIQLLTEKFGVKEIHISDDNFTFSRAHVEEFCSELAIRKIRIPWQCPNGVRIDTLDLALLKIMKAAGCYALGLGIESGSPVILKNVKKKLDLGIVKKALSDMKRAGIASYGFFILGLPGETEKTVKETIDFALKNHFDRAWFNVFTPYPGSEIFEDLVRERKISFENIPWDNLDCNTEFISSGSLSCKQVEYYQKKAVNSFYLRPRMLLDVVSKWGPKEVKTLLKTRFFKKRVKI